MFQAQKRAHNFKRMLNTFAVDPKPTLRKYSRRDFLKLSARLEQGITIRSTEHYDLGGLMSQLAVKKPQDTIDAMLQGALNGLAFHSLENFLKRPSRINNEALDKVRDALKEKKRK